MGSGFKDGVNYTQVRKSLAKLNHIDSYPSEPGTPPEAMADPRFMYPVTRGRSQPKAVWVVSGDGGMIYCGNHLDPPCLLPLYSLCAAACVCLGCDVILAVARGDEPQGKARLHLCRPTPVTMEIGMTFWWSFHKFTQGQQFSLIQWPTV